MNHSIKTIPALLFISLSLPLLVHAQGMSNDNIPAQQTNPAMAGNLFKNGDMSAGTLGWQGDRTFTDDGDNRVLMVKASKSGDRLFSQDIRTDKVTNLVVKFRYKTADYKGGGLVLKVLFQNNTTYSDMSLKADGQWHDMEFSDPEMNGKQSVKVIFDIKPGEGVIYFDDIIAKDKAAF